MGRTDPAGVSKPLFVKVRSGFRRPAKMLGCFLAFRVEREGHGAPPLRLCQAGNHNMLRFFPRATHILSHRVRGFGGSGCSVGSGFGGSLLPLRGCFGASPGCDWRPRTNEQNPRTSNPKNQNLSTPEPRTVEPPGSRSGSGSVHGGRGAFQRLPGAQAGLLWKVDPRHFRCGERKLSFCPWIEQRACHLLSGRTGHAEP